MELKHAIGFTKSVDTRSRSIDVIASDESIDSHGEIVDQSWDLTRYLQNPVILANHDPRTVVGRAENVRIENKMLLARIVFASTPKGEEMLTLYAEKAMRAVSVGFSPGKVVTANVAGRTVDRLCNNTLYEISCVAIGSNAHALAKGLHTRAIARGVIEPDDAPTMDDIVDGLKRDAYAYVDATRGMSEEQLKEHDAQLAADRALRIAGVR